MSHEDGAALLSLFEANEGTLASLTLGMTVEMVPGYFMAIDSEKKLYQVTTRAHTKTIDLYHHVQHSRDGLLAYHRPTPPPRPFSWVTGGRTRSSTSL